MRAAALPFGVLSIAASGCSSGSARATSAAPADAAAAGGDAENVRLVGLENSRPAEGLFNPITRQHEWNGTSILEISDPSRPRYVWLIPNEANASSRSVSVVY